MTQPASRDFDSDRAAQRQAGHRIEYLSIGWTSLEAMVGIAIGAAASSVALVGFGIDSLIEVATSVVLLWRLAEHKRAEEREELAHKLVGAGFLALAAYIAVDAINDLFGWLPPRATYFGVGYAIASVIVMPWLARAKRRVAAKLGSNALHADSHQSDICAYLAIILLAGLALNALFGLWWADPVAALCMLPILIKEGVSGLRGEACAYHHG